jgi:rhodanese-related sulfurtransferase
MIRNQTQTETAVNPQELRRRIAAGQPACLLDVRTPGEYAAAHVPGAKLIPLDELDPAAFSRERNGDASPVYVLCQSGGRARRAIEKLNRAGIQGCVLVEGGTQAWMDAGLPVNRGPSRVLPLMRQVQITVGFLGATGALLALTTNKLFALIPLVVGSGLLFAGLTGFCGLALLLAKMPWNQAPLCKSASCCATKSK